MNDVRYTCPQCGIEDLKVEEPDQYEIWLKCNSCGYFMGMSKDDWHRIVNSPNVNHKIKKRAEEYS